MKPDSADCIKLPRKPQAVIFDMDGLLFDTETIHLRGIESVSQKEGLAVTRAFAMSTIGLHMEVTKQRYVELLGPEFDFDLFWKAVSASFYEIARTDLRLKPGILELLEVLDQNKLPRAICTSSGHAAVKHHLAHFGISHRFHTVIAGGDYTQGKPHPEPYLQAAKRLGIASSLCLALEDSYNGVRSASGAGMMTIMVPDLLPSTDEMENLAVGIAKDLHDVIRAVKASIEN